ncbi:MAG: isoaspartyl peptidase/L-asparaginase [Candidatus Neomarinimicrobiota bacterium]
MKQKIKSTIISAVIFSSVFFYGCQSKDVRSNAQEDEKFVLVIHGGAGTILKKNMTPEKETAYIQKMTEALNNGHTILANGGSSLDAVESVIMMMEDSPLFNAGKGAVFTHEGTNELDASIMDGVTLNAGAVAAVKHIKNPIKLSRAVMERSPHVILAGTGAETFAQEEGFQLQPEEYFYTKRRWDSLQKALGNVGETSGIITDEISVYSTVGAVALDKHGNLAAGTSTGGMTNKRFGRIGDSPIIGAGTYANNKTCAVSGTGHGEYFIRGNVAYDISAMMEYGGKSLKESVKDVIQYKLIELGGTGGVIAVDKNGNIAMEFNTEGMYRGWVRNDETPQVLIYGND